MPNDPFDNLDPNPSDPLEEIDDSGGQDIQGPSIKDRFDNTKEKAQDLKDKAGNTKERIDGLKNKLGNAGKKGAEKAGEGASKAAAKGAEKAAEKAAEEVAEKGIETAANAALPGVGLAIGALSKISEKTTGMSLPKMIGCIIGVFVLGALGLILAATLWLAGGTGGTSNNSPIVPETGLMTPPNLDMSDMVMGVYYKMPESIDGSYTIVSCQNKRYGKLELIQFIYTVAQRWHQKHPDKKIRVGNLNTGYPPSVSHKWGIAVDITNNGLMMSNSGYNRELSIELIQEYFKTGLVKNLWYDDPVVIQRINSWLQQENLPGRIKAIGGHADHYHFDINIEKGPKHEPQC